MVDISWLLAADARVLEDRQALAAVHGAQGYVIAVCGDAGPWHGPATARGF